LCPEQIVLVGPAEKGTAALLDAFGNAHPLARRTVVGRGLAETGLIIREASVSRRHAEVRANEPAITGFSVRDLGSTNGTRINGNPVHDWAPLSRGDQLSFGDIRFFFIDARNGLGEQAFEIPTARLAEGEEHDEETQLGLPTVRVDLVEPRGGGGGFLQIDDHVVPLTIPQLELLRALCARMRDDEQEPHIVRGYVRSAELLAEISWDTQHPTENHLKQLVVRVRRNLARAGVNDLIESRRRLGYRLRVIPS
jgi:hypothetical protein